MLVKGLVQIYTGDGKGKATAAMGLALRAAGPATSSTPLHRGETQANLIDVWLIVVIS